MNMPPPLMQDDAASSSSSISSPPQSPPQHIGDEITVARRTPSSALGEGVVHPASANAAQPALAHNAASHTTNGSLPTADAAAKPKRTRKPAAKAEGNDKPVKEKKPRKPREPKVKKEGDAAATTTAPRKRQKTEEKVTPAPADAPAGPRQSTLTEMVSQFHPPGPPASAPPQQLPSQPPPYQPTPPTRSALPTPSATSSLPPPAQPMQPHTSNPPTPRPFSSGQNYDPIRGSTIDSAPPRTASAAANGAHSAQASPHVNRVSASPSITSLIDPHPSAATSAPTVSYSSQTTMQSQQQSQHQPPPPFVPSQQQSPTPPRAAPVQVMSTAAPPQPGLSLNKPIGTTMDGAMDIDGGPACIAPPKPDIKIQSKSSSSAPTPKPAPAKANSPPKATGSGLLSSSDLFGGPSSNTGSDRKGVDIEIRIALNPNGGNQINIAQEISKKYGRDAINPRAAAHREALLRVAAAANKIEGGSADDMSVDLMSEMDNDSNVEMGGIDEEKSNTGLDGDAKPRKRRKKVEEYDKEDDFIDDTELAWQEKAAVAKDGFFVYSGPLVPEGQAAQVESSAPARGGRGRGRGRGRAAASAGTTHAQLAEKKEATGRGRGRGRGTGAPRKPRITKADRERMEAEKAERERSAAGAGTPAMGATPTLVVQQQAPQQVFAANPNQGQQGVQV